MTRRKRTENALIALISAMLLPQFIADFTLFYSNSIFSILFAIFVYWILRKETSLITTKWGIVLSMIFGTLLACMTTFGYYLQSIGNIPWKSILFWISIAVYIYVYAAVIRVLWDGLIKFEIRLNSNHYDGKFTSIVVSIHNFLLKYPILIAVILIISWLPCYISDFPGSFRYDATAEFGQSVLGYNRNFPLLHSTIITTLLPAMYKLTGSYNTGIAVYCILQILAMATMFTCIITKLSKQGFNKLFVMAMLLYYAAFPFIQILVCGEVRDVMFSALLTCVIFLLYLISVEKKKFLSSVFLPLSTGLIIALTIHARNNNTGIISSILVFVVSVVLWLYNRYESRRGAAILSAAIVIGYFGMSALFTSICQPVVLEAAKGNSLSIMSQTLARAYLYENDTWTEDELSEINAYMDTEQLEYFPSNADPTKSKLHVDDNFSDFLLFWVKIGSQHKSCYLDAMLANTADMWFPGAIIDGYNESGVASYDEYEKCLYAFNDKLEKPANPLNYLPRVNKFYEQICLYISFEKIPIISMLFSIGFQFWILLNAMFYSIFRRQSHLLIPLTILLGYMLISSFVPLVLLRYFAAIFFALPMTLAFTVQPRIMISQDENRISQSKK